MRIFHISWEYPPVIYGGLGRHVLALSRAQAAAGHDVTVVTQRPTGTFTVEDHAGVRVVRTSALTPPVRRDLPGLMTWTADLDRQLAATLQRLESEPPPQVVHAHDWVVEQAATKARQLWSAPLVTTVHATEAGRHSGWVSGEPSETIYASEWRLARISSTVITCSEAMNREVRALYHLSADRVVTIPNGIDLTEWQSSPPDREQPVDEDPLIVFVGRLEWEKGIHVLIDAAQRIAPTVAARFIIAGTGTQSDRLHAQAANHPAIEFAGPVADADVRQLYSRAAAVVVPSLYEPFGIVALEAAAAGAPLIVSDVGGLAEIVDDGRTGLVVPANDPQSLSTAIRSVIADPVAARRRAATLSSELPDRFTWSRIAERTVAGYELALRMKAPPGDRDGKSAPPKPRGQLLP